MRKPLVILVAILLLAALGVTLRTAFGPEAGSSDPDAPPPPSRTAEGGEVGSRSPEDDRGPPPRVSRATAPTPRRPKESGAMPTLDDARALLRAGRPTEAANALDRILRERPKDADALSLRGRAYTVLGWHRRAERDFGAAVTAGGETAERLEDRAESLHRLRRDAEAEKLLRRALELDSGRARTHALLAVVLFQRGREKEAAEEARAARVYDPSEPLAKYVLDRVE